MFTYRLTQPWEYDEIAALNWLPQSVRDAFSRFSDRTKDIIAFKYINNGIIEGVGIAKFKHNRLGTHIVIGHLNVKDGCRGQGIGSALLNHFLEISVQNHVPCRLQVAPFNRGAKRLYGRFDFSVAPDEQDPGTLWMARYPLSFQPAHNAAHDFAGDSAAY
ncbi:MAG TPA: GNAT family N-acetyltransferase [Alphaproteobacteria bacterium]|nr:GNAT family N-acetyltransferase [Alphaproteobacteria bacterium]USO06587.1 MAG: GNAT family N-acetyltransferase [Rhodospirillales bacterium]HOO82540.1 GNAT family N-acetyltransferase [Alphaproteobacteria bacterium]